MVDTLYTKSSIFTSVKIQCSTDILMFIGTSLSMK